MDKPFVTRITELFGIRLPIIAGGLQWLANAEYVAAAANAGIIGFITAASFPELDDLRAEKFGDPGFERLIHCVL